MIRPEPSAPPPTRDDLAQQVSFLPWKLFKGMMGGKTAQEVRELAQNMASEGATQKEIYDATARFAGQHETGLFQNPAGQHVFELSDKGSTLTPEAMQWMQNSMGQTGGYTPEMNLRELLRHNTLYDYSPRIGDVKTQLNQPYSDEIGSNPTGGYDSPETASGRGTPAGRIEVFGANDLPPDSIQNNSVLNILGHETQHGLQYLHGMPRGGNDTDQAMQAFFESQMKPQANQMRIMAETEREKYARDYAQLFGGTDEAIAKGRLDWAQAKPEQATILSQSQYVGGAPGSAKEGRLSTPPLTPFGQYTSLAGEQSAQRAAERWDWGTEQRRENPAFLAEGHGKLAPGLQMLKMGPGLQGFQKPDLRWSLANTAVRGR